MKNPSPRPIDPAPGGMGGATRMHDPSEAEHDRTRRRWMNAAFVAILLANFAQLRLVGVHGRDWISLPLLMVAAIPLGLTVKMFELRFKMADDERRLVLGELPTARKIALVAYGTVATAAFALQPRLLSWALWGLWLYDFITYYHDRPERIRHLYAVTKILDELRGFPVPWAWPVPALIWGLVRKTLLP